MAEIDVTVLGLRRIGTSFALALQRYNRRPGSAHRFNITGYDPDSAHGRVAKDLGALDKLAGGLHSAVRDAEVVITDMPYSQVEGVFRAMGDSLKAGCVVLDCSPLKMPSEKWASKYFGDDVYLVGISPLINPDLLHEIGSGPKEADASLFAIGGIGVAPGPNCPQEAVQLAAELIQLIGSKPFFLDPVEHDGMAAATVGIPALMGLSLMRVAATSSSWEDMRHLTNTAFALAVSPMANDPDDIRELILLNRDNLLHYLKAAISQMDQMRELIENGEDEVLEAVLIEAAQDYRRWWEGREVGEWKPKSALREMPRLEAGLLGNLGRFFTKLTTRRTDDEEE